RLPRRGAGRQGIFFRRVQPDRRRSLAALRPAGRLRRAADARAPALRPLDSAHESAPVDKSAGRAEAGGVKIIRETFRRSRKLVYGSTPKYAFLRYCSTMRCALKNEPLSAIAERRTCA